MFHINNKNQLKPCKAKVGKCRFIQCQSELQGNFILEQIHSLRNEYQTVIQKEPQHTEKMIEISKQTNGELVGLDYRTKTFNSLKEKILIRGKGKSAFELFDICRYTIKFPTSELSEKNTNYTTNTKR